VKISFKNNLQTLTERNATDVLDGRHSDRMLVLLKKMFQIVCQFRMAVTDVT
jgi:hypothetical protein